MTSNYVILISVTITNIDLGFKNKFIYKNANEALNHKTNLNNKKF